MHKLILFIFIAFATFQLFGQNESIEISNDSSYFRNQLFNQGQFLELAGVPSKSNYTDIKSVKGIYDRFSGQIYYMNLQQYNSHYAFAKSVLGYKKNDTDYLYWEYSLNEKRQYFQFTINYHKTLERYVLEFSAYDQIDCNGVRTVYDKIMESPLFADNLFFYVNNKKWMGCMNLPFISSEELYLGQNYQALNLEESYGFLSLYQIKDMNHTFPGKHDIVIMDGIPNQVPPVAGIITSEYQTPLSHINILSHNRKTPNMTLRNVFTDSYIKDLIGELVYLKVGANSYEIRKASIEEAQVFWNRNMKRELKVLNKDIEISGLVELNDTMRAKVEIIGGKAANFGEMLRLETIPVPEDAFSIPFYYYQQHLEEHGIDKMISRILKRKKFYTNQKYRKKQLEKIRKEIKDSPLNSEFLNLVRTRIGEFEKFGSYRFRSSTNAEDLEDFSGAGLYKSCSAKKSHKKKTIERAIKKVWASLWDIRAFDERECFMIDQHSVAMGILVHRSFPNEDANGVVITKNLYNINHAYTINVQAKENSIVKPEAGVLHDQILMYTIALDGSRYTIEYLTHSNLPSVKDQNVLTDKELIELADYCTILKNHYYNNIPNSCNCKYEDFALDIEFKIDSQKEFRKIYIKQVRLFMK